MNRAASSLAANRHLLGQARDLVERLTDEQYARARGPWSSVGAQLRHVLEHYQCFLEGLPAGAVDYDSRRRDPVIERDRHHAAGLIDALRDDLVAVRAHAGPFGLRVQMRTQAAAHEPEWSESTVARETQFLVSHTVHHFALIKLLLAADGLALDPAFGVAPSTLAHDAQTSCAR